jgi:hypothetical protein
MLYERAEKKENLVKRFFYIKLEATHGTFNTFEYKRIKINTLHSCGVYVNIGLQ